jgi:hypothetical protein
LFYKHNKMLCLPRINRTRVAAAIDHLAGPRKRTEFVVELLEREIRRREQLDALSETAGSWKDEDHTELAAGADQWVQRMRQESTTRFEMLQQRRQSE